MQHQSSEFEKFLAIATEHAESYVHYSESQVEKGEHLLNNPKIGERAWSIPQTTGEFLYKLITQNGLQNGLELGTSIGYSTLWVISALTENNPDAKLVTIEKNEAKSQIAQSYLLPTFTKNITFHTGRILDFLPNIHNSFDFVFMDADRGNYQEYWKYIFPLLNKKSIVIIDNASRVQKSVQEFQETLTNDPRIKTHLHGLDNGLLIITLAESNYSNIQNLINN